jgi:phospholipid/cholesterol/gamma-HCH transport system substrate-binding protein
MQQQALSLRGRGVDLSNAIASLDPFAEEADRALRLLDSQSQAVSGLVRNSGAVFEALSERQGQLRGLVENTNAVFETTARRNEDLAAAFSIFPTFLRESRETLARLGEFANDNDATITALRPTAREIEPTFASLANSSPELNAFFTGLRTTIDRAKPGFTAIRGLLDDDLPPILARLDPYLGTLNSLLAGLNLYKHEITAFLGNATAATQGFLEINPENGLPVHYLRTEAPLTPEVLSTYSKRLDINRSNPYMQPGGYADVRTALKSFETLQCGRDVNAVLPDRTATINDPAFNVRTDGDVDLAADYFDRIKLFAFNDQPSTATIVPPPCNEQAQFESIGSPRETSQYLHVFPQP